MSKWYLQNVMQYHTTLFERVMQFHTKITYSRKHTRIFVVVVVDVIR